MTSGVELLEDGTRLTVDVRRDSLQSTKVFCIIDNSTHSVYLWKGNQCGMRKQLAGALAATEIRLECGERYRVQAIDQGEEPPSFFNSLEVRAVRAKPQPQSTPRARLE